MVEDLVTKYIELRGKRDEIMNAAKAKAAKIDEALAKVEGVLLQLFDEQGMQSVKTPHGTAYKSTRTSATVADWEQVLGFIRENDAWPMLEKRVNKTAVAEYMESTGELPPGVNVRTEVTLNIRRS